MQDRKFEATAEIKSRLLRQAVEDQTATPAGQSILSTQRDPLTGVTCRLGDASCAQAHATRLNRQPARSADSLLQLQRQYGNRYVQRVLALSRKADSAGEVTPEIETDIQRVRGGGQALDSAVRAQMQPAFGADFSGVRVHTGAEADTLNHALSARAFTTGQDIFFREGQYSPGSLGGRELLAHELTHVVQQTGGLQRKLVVGAPNDVYEQEADRVARAVIQQEQQTVKERTGEGPVRRQMEEEEEKEEPIQTKTEDAGLRRQTEEEEEEVAP